MGMFSSLFGKSGSNKADQMRQKALDAFNAIQTPALKDLQVQLEKYVDAGQLTPEQAESQMLNSNAFQSIQEDPSLQGAQKAALSSLQNVGNQGGLTAVDKAQLNDITNQQNQEAQGRNASIMQNAQQRGVGNSDLNTVNQLMNEQGAANRASQQGTDVAAQAQARALQAMQAAGTQAGNIRSQNYGQAANAAQAQNAIDLFNKQTLNQTNLYNTQASNQAQAANLQNAQDVSNANTGVANTQATQNANANQQQFNDNMAKAQGVAGTYTGWANQANADAKANTDADQQFMGKLIQGGATVAGGMAGGPPGAMAANSATAPGGITSESDLPGGGGYNPNAYNKDELDQRFSHYEGGMIQPLHTPDFHQPAHAPMPHFSSRPPALPHPMHLPHQYAQGGAVCGYANGGMCGYDHGGEVLPVVGSEDAKGWTIKDPHGNDIGTFRNYTDALAYAEQVQKKQPKKADYPEKAAEPEQKPEDFKSGGLVPGHAQVPGNSPQNDTVPAMVSPGEVVIPRSAMNDDQEFDKFMAQFRPTKRTAPVDESVPLEKRALNNLRNTGGK